MTNIDYLNIARAEDLKEKKEKIFYRCLEILPGFLALTTLFLATILSWLKPVVIAIFIILFNLYWLLKVFYLSFHQVSSFLKMKRNLKINWLEKVKRISDWKKIYHLVILPFYKEGKEIIEGSLNSLLNSQYPKNKMIVVLAGEERAGEKAKEIAKEIEREFSGKFFQFLVTIHPKDLKGEIAGKGSNFAWAFKEVKEKIIQPSKIPSENIIVSNFDIDTRPYPHYFSCLTYHYLRAKKPARASYQPIPIYNNNIWQAPAFSRVVATSGTFWQMMQQERIEQLVSYSSHSLPFKVLEEVGYPSNLVSDDSRIFWKSYLYYNGDYRVIPLHYPVSMDAVLAKNLLRTIVNQYKQQRRWAWGVENIPYLIFGFFKNPAGKISWSNKKIPLFEKFRHSFIILEGFWSWATAGLLIFFLGWLPLILGGPDFNITLISYNLPRLTRNLMTLAIFGMVISSALNLLILPPRPEKCGRLKNFSIILQWLLLPLTLVVFGSIPALEAQIRLLFGKYLGFWSTEKVRVKDQKEELKKPEFLVKFEI